MFCEQKPEENVQGRLSPSRHYWHFGPNGSLSWAAVCGPWDLYSGRSPPTGFQGSPHGCEGQNCLWVLFGIPGAGGAVRVGARCHLRLWTVDPECMFFKSPQIARLGVAEESDPWGMGNNYNIYVWLFEVFFFIESGYQLSCLGSQFLCRHVKELLNSLRIFL